MNLVGFGLTAHDSSIAAYKNGKFFYIGKQKDSLIKNTHTQAWIGHCLF